MDTTQTIQIRKLSVETRRRLRLKAVAREWTYAELIEALEQLHETLLARAREGDAQALRDLEGYGLQ